MVIIDYDEIFYDTVHQINGQQESLMQPPLLIGVHQQDNETLVSVNVWVHLWTSARGDVMD